MTSDRVYRITLRMDDGSTQVVMQEATPDFRSGDRVNHSGGMIRH
jgi:outer membrane lipoprotein SlyB